MIADLLLNFGKWRKKMWKMNLVDVADVDVIVQLTGLIESLKEQTDGVNGLFTTWFSQWWFVSGRFCKMNFVETSQLC